MLRRTNCGVSEALCRPHHRFTRRGNITDTIYALGRDRESSDVQVIVKLPPPQLQADRNVSVRVPYRDACAVAVFDDSIYMLGGSDDNRDATNQVDRINPLDGSVSSVPSMTLPRRRPSAAATDRHLLVFGGDNGLWLASCEAFDSITNQWTVLPDMPTPRSASAAVNVPDVGVVVVGGWDASMRFSNRAELLAGSVEGENDCSWTRLVSMLDARLCPAVAFFQGRVVVAGGNDYGSITFECLPLNPGGPHPGQWTRLATPQLLDAWPLSLAVFRERLLLASGLSSHNPYFHCILALLDSPYSAPVRVLGSCHFTRGSSFLISYLEADGEVWECFPAPGPSESPSAWVIFDFAITIWYAFHILGLVLRRIVVETTIQSRKYFQAKAFSVTATKLSPLYTLQLNEIDYVKLEFAM
uniref:BACK domain-containing protein n=2 Tax=Mesocestoides corti TaxID=53468 RepID=A0A5K3G0H6_MESCO